MPTLTPMTLVPGVLLAAAAPAHPGVYGVPIGSAAILRALRFVNTDSVVRHVSLHLVANGATVGAKNRVLGPFPLGPAGSPTSILVDTAFFVLESGDYLAPFADVANVVAFRADGAELSP